MEIVEHTERYLTIVERSSCQVIVNKISNFLDRIDRWQGVCNRIK